MYWGLLFLATAVVCAFTEQRYPLDLVKLRELQIENNNTDSFLYTKPLFKAIHSGKRIAEIKKTRTNYVSNNTHFSIYSYHNTSITIGLLDGRKYFSLDDDKVSKGIHEIRLDYIIDCSNRPSPGDYYLGTSDSNHKDIKQQSNYGIQTGLVFSRKIKKCENIYVGSKTCVKAYSELVHPLETINTKISSYVSFPYERLLAGDSIFSQPDSPLMLCNNKKVISKQAFIHKDGSDITKVRGVPLQYTYSFDVDGNECLSVSAAVPGSINFNHGSGTKAIKSNINLASGIVCTNCYAFMGASVLAVINIFGGDVSTFAFQAKSEGGLGYNLDILVNNPSFSASKYINLAGAGPVSSVPIAYGLSLDINFAGAWATVKGSGSARGSASFSSGYTLEEKDYIMYSRSKWTSSHSLINSNSIMPVYKNKGLSLSTTSFSAVISLSARIAYSFGGSVPVIGIGASVQFSTVITATAQYVKWGKSYSLSFDDDRRKLSDNENYYSGDKMHFNIKYSGLNPSEKHELYVNIHKPDFPNGYPIKMVSFVSSHNGNGLVAFDWTVPYDNKFASTKRDVEFSVHSSARLDRFYSNKKVKITQKREPRGDPMFTFPKNGDVLTVNQPIFIIWNKNGMRFFKHKQGSDGIGLDESPKRVNIVLVCDDTKRAYQLANNIDNSGSHIAALPETLLSLCKRFFLAIHDADEYNKIHWMPGSFSLKKRPFRIRQAPVRPISLVPVNIEAPLIENGLPLWNNTLLMLKTNTSHINRRLASSTSCPNAALSVMLQIEFGFDGFTLMGHHTSLGSTSSNPFTIIPQKNFCV